MNKNELHGGARYVGGKVEKAVGDAVGSRDWQVAGVVDQVAGGAENLYGRARSIGEDAVDAAPAIADHAREKLADAADAIGETAQRTVEQAREAAGRAGETVQRVAGQASDAARRGGKDANAAMSANALLWAVGAAIGGYALGWLIHGRTA
ncbi:MULTISPECIES: CsbD family protein [Sphingomonas]|uniref:CsbD family protein n=1 Tax=Sphingomonas TaxID=13687 RepID=UPI001AED8F3F|nr:MULTISPECIES: CsbD family protein [Sphingomonas]